MRPRRSSQRLPAATSEQEAALYDAHVVPRYSALFGRLLIAEIDKGSRVQVLDLGCGTGYPAIEIMRRLGEGGRVIAVDRDATKVDLARRRALDETGRRIFFKTEPAETLSFGDGVFDIVAANLVLAEAESAEQVLEEIRRVLVEGGRLITTLALAGTFEEVLDMFREIALKRDLADLSQRLDRIAHRYPSEERLEPMLTAAGFRDVRVRREEFQLPLASATELFQDPLLRLVALPEWRWICGFGPEGSTLLEEVQRSLDIYFGGGPLTLRVSAGLVTART